MAKNLTLGLTKIGDLLFNKKITISTKDNKPIVNVKLKVPEYQRPYKWAAKNANLLFDDIVDAMHNNKEVYRVGTLILHYDEKEDCFNIVDGQQRTITFALLLKCLSEDRIEFLDQNLSNNQFTIHNVINNKRALERRIEKIEDEKESKDLRDYICNQCELIVVITSDLSEAFQFFDSQNTRGKKLYPHDLLKAYHLREMQCVDIDETVRIVKTWEELNQKKLSVLFNEYLYRLKKWVKGERAYELNEHNIDIFKGISSRDNYPYAQFYKGAYAFADDLNNSKIPFATGIHSISPFQINTPVIAGKPFFEYAKHYFDILVDIQNNDKYEGYFLNDNDIVKTLDLRKYKNGVGNRITRLMFDTAILLYVDRFCKVQPTKNELVYLEQFVVFAFIWAYSMRAQYKYVGWLIAQNYIMGEAKKDKIVNDINMYKIIADSDSPRSLLSKLADLIVPLDNINANTDKVDTVEDGIYQNYLHYFIVHRFWEMK